MPSAHTMPCVDCGGTPEQTGLRHEYDHFAGYDGNSQLLVEAVCSRCHHARESARQQRPVEREEEITPLAGGREVSRQRTGPQSDPVQEGI